MKNTLAALVVRCLAILAIQAGTANAADRCRLTASGAEVLVRYPIDHGDPQRTQHTNKHVIWTIVGTEATPGEALGDEDPRIGAVGNFASLNACQALWEEREPDGTSIIRLATTNGFFQVEGSAFLNGTERPPLPWDVASSFDLTGDGRADLLWWNPENENASVVLWTWSDNGGWSSQQVVGGLAQGWRPVGAARLEANGAPGIIWYNPAVNQTLLYHRTQWTGQGLMLQSVAEFEGLNQSGWTIVAIGDYDGDGKEDFLRQDDLTRRLQVCFMDGLVVRDACQPLNPDGFELAQQNPPQEWYVVGPR